MTARRPHVALLYKETRALLYTWFGCVALLILPRTIDWHLGTTSVMAYCVGAAVLGALSMGRDYTEGTLGVMLSLPVPRVRLLIVKQGVLAVLLLLLLGIAFYWLQRTGSSSWPLPPLWIYSLPVLFGLFVAPALTLLCRNPIAGAVFTIGIFGSLWAAGEWIGILLYGYGSDMYAFRLSFFWRATLLLCGIGCVLTWRMFLRLEAIEGLGGDLGLPGWLGSARERSATSSAMTRHPLALLILKELHLQQLPIVLGVLNLLGWMVLTMALSDSPLLDAFTAISVFVAGLLAALIGATASAGERQLGTLEWQVLMPIPASIQWVVKAGVAITLALLLSVALLAFYAYLHAGLNPRQLLDPVKAVLIILITASSLYVSSLCRTALWALLMSLLVIFAAGTYAAAVERALASPSLALPSGTALSVFMAAPIAPLLWFGHTNHRTADRAAGSTGAQVIAIVGIFTAGIVVATRAL